MKLNKDIYLYLTKFADDHTILNMLSVNKRFNSDKIFQQVMKQKYPLLVQYKSRVESWKEFFISMILHIHKIKKNYDIPYYPVEGNNPRIYSGASRLYILNIIMLLSVENNNINMVKLMINTGADSFDWAMTKAAKIGNKDIIELMIQHGAKDFNRAMAEAAYYGHKDIVELMIKKGASNFNWPMIEAAESGHKDIVELMIEKGATHINEAKTYARLNNNQDIVDYLELL